jgi:hydroxymethylpyrimidine pyrophosphatase-like HAD family hydrolase
MPSQHRSPVRLIAIDLDGTLLGLDGQVGERNRTALNAAERAGIEIVIATGRRHCYAMKVLRSVNLPDRLNLVSSNGAVVRRLDSHLVETTLMAKPVAAWLCGHLGEFRNALVITFDRVMPDGEDSRGALVVEDLEDLNTSIGRWMAANEPYIAHVRPIEECLNDDAPIQMMLCGTVERMRRAEALMRQDPRVAGVGEPSVQEGISLNRTEYPERDLSIVDILPAGCSKGAAVLRLAEARGLTAAEVMAIGDNWNDVSMLEMAGWPVLMGNAPEDLLAGAAARGWELTSTHDADGVAAAIERAIASHTEPAAHLLTAAASAGSK